MLFPSLLVLSAGRCPTCSHPTCPCRPLPLSPRFPRGSSILDHLRANFSATRRSFPRSPWECTSRHSASFRRGAGVPPARAILDHLDNFVEHRKFPQIPPYLIICAQLFLPRAAPSHLRGSNALPVAPRSIGREVSHLLAPYLPMPPSSALTSISPRILHT